MAAAGRKVSVHLLRLACLRQLCTLTVKLWKLWVPQKRSRMLDRRAWHASSNTKPRVAAAVSVFLVVEASLCQVTAPRPCRNDVSAASKPCGGTAAAEVWHTEAALLSAAGDVALPAKTLLRGWHAAGSNANAGSTYS
jgi:hypothetical protein